MANKRPVAPSLITPPVIPLKKRAEDDESIPCPAMTQAVERRYRDLPSLGRRLARIRMMAKRIIKTSTDPKKRMWACHAERQIECLRRQIATGDTAENVARTALSLGEAAAKINTTPWEPKVAQVVNTTRKLREGALSQQHDQVTITKAIERFEELMRGEKPPKKGTAYRMVENEYHVSGRTLRRHLKKTR